MTRDDADEQPPSRFGPPEENNDDIFVFRDQDAVDRLRGHDSLVVGHRQVSQYAESRSQSVILGDLKRAAPSLRDG